MDNGVEDASEQKARHPPSPVEGNHHTIYLGSVRLDHRLSEHFEIQLYGRANIRRFKVQPYNLDA